MNHHLHIVCLDCPTPADYGGAIDMFYRIKALSLAGVQVHLHYFQYNQRSPSAELKKLCVSIHAYNRVTGRKGLRPGLPYIVTSRINQALTEALNADEYPVLLEGIHCTGIISSIRPGKKVAVRMHNDEATYYGQLARTTGNVFRKLYYRRESRLLEKYQRKLPPGLLSFCISEQEAKIFSARYRMNNVHYVPAFVPFSKVSGKEGVGDFCLYHGNLGVEENEKAALWLIKKVFRNVPMKLIIAGKDPSRRLIKAARSGGDISIIANPLDKEMEQLIRDAHIHVLPSFSETGTKLKLLHAVFEGRHCVVNEAMVKKTGVEAACYMAGNATAFASLVMQLKHQPFTEEEIKLRTALLKEKFSNEQNARDIMKYLYWHYQVPGPAPF